MYRYAYKEKHYNMFHKTIFAIMKTFLKTSIVFIPL